MSQSRAGCLIYIFARIRIRVVMGISETLGNAYMRVEDAYYGVLDFFEEKE